MPTPFYVLAASVSPGNRVKGFYQPDGSSPARLLDHPESFRYAGFDVTTGDYAKLVDDHWQVQSGDRKLIQLYQDGVLLFRMRADAEFLGWGAQNRHPTGSLNPVAVVESHTSFVHLYAALLTHLLTEPREVRFSLRFENGMVNGTRLALTQYYSQGIQNVSEPKRYPLHDPNATDEHRGTARLLLDRPNRRSYEVLAKFYELFDADTDLIPFTTVVNGELEIDVSAIQRL